MNPARLLRDGCLLCCLSMLCCPVEVQGQDSFAGSNAPLRLSEVADGTNASVEPHSRLPLGEQPVPRKPTGIFAPIQQSLQEHWLRTENRQSGGDLLDPQPTENEQGGLPSLLESGPASWVSREGLGGTLQVILLASVVSLAPAILLMTTCYVRVIVVLGLLRQALGTGQLPPTQVLTSISLFITLFVMTPVWNRIYTESIQPYTAENSEMSWQEAWQSAAAPVRDFMSRQIDVVGNQDDVHLFYRYHAGSNTPPSSYEEVPLQVLLPAYVLSELKTAFLMGFLIYLPFLIIDLVVAAVTISMGMMMLPPAMISLPFKLLLFVLVDGWHLVVGMLLQSFGNPA